MQIVSDSFERGQRIPADLLGDRDSGRDRHDDREERDEIAAGNIPRTLPHVGLQYPANSSGHSGSAHA